MLSCHASDSHCGNGGSVGEWFVVEMDQFIEIPYGIRGDDLFVVSSAELLCNLSGARKFTELLLLKPDGKRLDWVANNVAGAGDDCAAVHSREI